MSDEADTTVDDTKDAPFRMGIFSDHPDRRMFSAADLIALVLSVFWAGVCLLFFLMVGFGGEATPLTYFLTTVGVAMPIGMFWLAASAANSAQRVREESDRIQEAIDAIRHVYIEQQQEHTSAGLPPAVEKRLAEIEALAANAQRSIASMPHPDAVAATPVPAPEPQEPQPELALDTPPEPEPVVLGITDVIRALNFPEDGSDRAGFSAMRAAYEDHRTAGLMRAAQDLLTMLSEEGIYMDDLRPDRTRPELWRRFADGERGAAIAGLGAIRDRSSLSLTSARMRQDTVFRDTAHHFLNRFDRVLTELAPQASDEELVRLSDTRTARAFMLLSRVSGTFG